MPSPRPDTAAGLTVLPSAQQIRVVTPRAIAQDLFALR